MFSGIVEEYATLVALVKDQENIHFTFKCSFVNELKIDQSISHNGVCLTVVSLTDDTYTVTAMKETLERSNLGQLSPRTSKAVHYRQKEPNDPPLKSSPTSPLLPDVLYHTPGHSAGKVPIAESLYIPYYLY